WFRIGIGVRKSSRRCVCTRSSSRRTGFWTADIDTTGLNVGQEGEAPPPLRAAGYGAVAKGVKVWRPFLRAIGANAIATPRRYFARDDRAPPRARPRAPRAPRVPVTVPVLASPRVHRWRDRRR